MTGPIGIALIGCGNIGTKAQASARLVWLPAVCDLHAEQSAEFSRSVDSAP